MTTLKIYPERKQRNGTVAGGKKNVIKGKFLCVFLLKQEIIESFNCRGKCSHTETRIDNTRGKRADRRSLKEILRDRKIPWRRQCLPTPVFLPGEFHGQRSLVGYSPGVAN